MQPDDPHDRSHAITVNIPRGGPAPSIHVNGEPVDLARAADNARKLHDLRAFLRHEREKVRTDCADREVADILSRAINLTTPADEPPF
ncbi:hypothetical protein [Umezawaea sp. Da 62-37]|uniref:hypothetical protein n=1 Tax=Umezawaea sp. Da 62-37 TaxID=3075927 RepID=UPI0028F6C22C|nr:hypothetical protein [Umezawaea sp. Da 62-37]WNV85077.1 hypothetical protein RM788_44205 [Umezawaea sp. Da 62-37]